MTTTDAPLTLSQRITEGRLPVPEALHYALSLAESLRKLHDAGRAHGAVTPSSIYLTATGLELIPPHDAPAALTPYTAPEVTQGQPADARSDIFSFGALVFEMLTGRRAFEAGDEPALTLALCTEAPPASGSPAVDRLVAGCVAKNPAARWQRMQKILMELKLLTVAVRRADAASAVRTAPEHATRPELEQLEARLHARLASHEKAVAQLQQSATEVIHALREHVAGIGLQIAAVEQRPVQPPIDVDGLVNEINQRMREAAGAVSQQLLAILDEKIAAVNGRVDETVQGMPGKLDAANQQLLAQVEEKIAAVSGQVNGRMDETAAAVSQKSVLVDQALEGIRKHFDALQASVATDLREFEHNLKAQSMAIESAKTAMTQTDDLVERVVEALDLLQSSMLDPHEAIVN